MESKYIKALDVTDFDHQLYPGDKIKIYGKETTITGFSAQYNDGLRKWETIIHTIGRGDPFERTLSDIEVPEEQPRSYEQRMLKPQPGAVWVKANITKVLEWAEKFYSENADQLMLDDNVWYISELEEDSEDVRNCREVTAEELADLYLMHHPDESAAGREEDKAHFDNWHRWLSDNGYTYDGEYYYDEDNNYFTPDQLWVKFK